MTLSEIKSLDRECLTAAEIAPIIEADPNWIRRQARIDKSKLGFNVIVIGSRVKIPRIPFLQFMGVQAQ